MINSLYLERYAQLIVDHSVQAQKDDYIAINATANAEPLITEIYKYLLQIGAYPVMNVSLPATEQTFYTYAQDHHLDNLSKFDEFRTYNIAGRVTIKSPSNTKALSNIDPKKQLRYAKTIRKMFEYGVRNHRWLGCQFPTEALAQDANMSLVDYTTFLFNALHLDSENPTKIWRERGKRQEELIKRLSKVKQIRIKNAETDLTLSVENRIWINGQGIRNLPCGEIFTGPVENSAQGHILFDLPSSVDGREVRNIRLEFKDGEVIKASAEVGNEFLQARLNTDSGAKRLGELGIGTNYKIKHASRSILLDEKIGGTIHLALGSSYEESGGLNHSAIHWDMICDLRQGGEIYADGELLQQNGQFLDFDLDF